MGWDNDRFAAVDIGEVTVVRMTEKAILVRLSGGRKEKWIPKSQICEASEIDGDSSEDDSGHLLLPSWLVDEENLG